MKIMLSLVILRFLNATFYWIGIISESYKHGAQLIIELCIKISTHEIKHTCAMPSLAIHHIKIVILMEMSRGYLFL